MNAEKFTPGPWSCSVQEDGCSVAYRIDDANGYEVGVTSGRDNEGEEEANARLIAAAPDYHVLVEDALPILEAVLEDREAANGEEDEILRDLLDRCRVLVAKVNAGASS